MALVVRAPNDCFGRVPPIRVPTVKNNARLPTEAESVPIRLSAPPSVDRFLLWLHVASLYCVRQERSNHRDASSAPADISGAKRHAPHRADLDEVRDARK